MLLNSCLDIFLFLKIFEMEPVMCTLIRETLYWFLEIYLVLGNILLFPRINISSKPITFFSLRRIGYGFNFKKWGVVPGIPTFTYLNLT